MVDLKRTCQLLCMCCNYPQNATRCSDQLEAVLLFQLKPQEINQMANTVTNSNIIL